MEFFLLLFAKNGLEFVRILHVSTLDLGLCKMAIMYQIYNVVSKFYLYTSSNETHINTCKNGRVQFLPSKERKKSRSQHYSKIAQVSYDWSSLQTKDVKKETKRALI